MQNFDQIFADPRVVLFARALVALIMVTAGLAKLVEGGTFIGVVRNYKLLPEWATVLVGHTLPIVEVVVGMSLLAGVLQPWSGYSAAGLFLLFAGAISINLVRGRRNISCGCFGVDDQRLSWALVLRNLLLTGVAFFAGYFVPTSTTAPLTTIEAVITVLIAAAILAASWVRGMILNVRRLPSLVEEQDQGTKG